jgi:PAS domain S-box-containing protein
VVATDPQGRIEVFNQTAERLFGVAAAAALGRPYAEVLDDLGPLVQAVEEEREVLGQTCDYRPARGSALTLALSTSLVRNSKGEVETVVAVIQDLSEKVAMEAHLRRRDRLASMGVLASGVAHEVRNPLNAISVIVQRLAREFEPRADQEEYGQLIGVVRDEVERVNRIVKQFLSLARPPQLQVDEVDLESLLQRSVRVITSRAAAKGLTVESDFAGIGRIEADAEQLEQVLLNLLSNAVEATADGEIGLSARAVGDDGVEIVVEDTGAGIPAAQLERIFDLYFTTKAEGTGLGLSLVHRIVSEHEGRINVESEAGAGTIFTLFLPRRG